MSGRGGYLARVKITIIQGLKTLGYEPNKFLDWVIGGLPPHKDNAPKTFAPGGNYCLYWYDPQWLLPVIEAFMADWSNDRERQLDLFEQYQRGVQVDLSFAPLSAEEQKQIIQTTSGAGFDRSNGNGEGGIDVDLIL